MIHTVKLMLAFGCNQSVIVLIFVFVFVFAGPPSSPQDSNIFVQIVGDTTSTLLISWSPSNCAVQYVVTIINSSDDTSYWCGVLCYTSSSGQYW